MRRVVITGIGIVSPIGIGAEAFWRNLLEKQVGVRRIACFDPSGFASHVGGEVPEFKIAQEVPKSYRKATKVMARDIELAILAAKDAFASARLRSRADDESGAAMDFDPARFGCNIGAGLISAELNELTYAFDQARREPGGNEIDWGKWGAEGMQQLTPLWMLKYLPNMLASHVTIIHGLTGPSNNITSAEASGHLSIGEAFRTIQRGDADFAIAGGAESKLNPMGLMRQQLLGRLSTTCNDRPAEAVRPFDAAAAGTAIAEGGALLILEEHERARSRGATIYAEVAGFGARQDPHDPILPDPGGRAYADACRAALGEAGAGPSDVDAIVPHGLGIPAHDASEMAGLREVFGEDLKRPAMCPIKAQIGCTAAGCAIDAAAAALIVHSGRYPAALNTRSGELNVSREVREGRPKVVLTGVFGLGGQNAALVLRKV
jgi:3-oxoacyl-[acyl-carrier-protein] synthase II